MSIFSPSSRRPLKLATLLRFVMACSDLLLRTSHLEDSWNHLHEMSLVNSAVNCTLATFKHRLLVLAATLAFICSFITRISPCNEEEDVEGQRHGQGQPPPVPDEVSYDRQEQLPQRVTVTRYRPHHCPHTGGDPLHNYKWKKKTYLICCPVLAWPVKMILRRFQCINLSTL